MNFNYQVICNNLLKESSPRSKDVLEKRFGLNSLSQLAAGGKEKRTLESIGQDFGICRERVRQIEKDCLKSVKEVARVSCQKPFQYFENQIRLSGNLRKEDSLVSELAPSKFKNQILFLLTIGDQFQRFQETQDFYSFWTVDLNSLPSAKIVIDDFIETLSQKNKSLTMDQYIKEKTPTLKFGVGSRALFSYLEISKCILRNPQGMYGFSNWPEINPKGVKDRAYLAFKKENKPLHFVQVAKTIGRETNIQTVHNELIKDPRFVLVGRGIYALSEWGFEPGVVREVIADTLKKAGKPLEKPEILKEVLKQRLVKEDTIFLNLNNKKYFSKDPRGRYYIREG
ncbi:MAG: hypothetical protein CO031_02330 [Candidatus Nealsonbacteria bacterium CG_4_9_14_0_2_um_filter_37_38]|uniref:RNA polymerase sigma-70 region 4 domain-containing protein n=1 Tax=Candidatus Nealsonbacteria bacterium CG_4_10_14_0_8_um_filter_37_14 TaxID=1974684 RepID=A0A2M7R7I1_9BACT|nr:MAG: hypothetical protein COZ89_03230 [Candidatus Nealsonbacteria bacterium CG_4_8_14_3_um_filter_37_23]PIY89485.1 MAG: hypothetical protein COY73_00855 [Candidatus Nealsonbacteria bacterium CG_4_10_14_0_8_um_filter_37_14]PJC51515.1 MAG: hypothetical protein CO031_02330 [Candidatus Nealsonbacteria bacterium CG_4_9_14_0_2_um_filter_37_38]